mgnify:CR=1 FL=1
MHPSHFLVPFFEKDHAKSLGARWDGQAGFWRAPNATVAAAMAAHWAPLTTEPLEALLPGEDRSFGGNELFVDLVPRSCWFTNVRSCIDVGSWARLSRLTRERAHHRCEICNASAAKERKVFLEAHERWDYNPTTHVQSLRRIVTLCTPCHLVTHWGYAQVSGRERLARAHFKAVAGIGDQEITRRVQTAFALWDTRSRQAWTLDVSMLSCAGLKVVNPSSR